MTGPAGPQKNSRDSAYTPEIGDRIITLMSVGKSLRDIGEEPGMPDYTTICRWGDNPELSDQEFPQRYARARVSGCHAQFEQMREIEKKLLDEKFDDPQNARIALDTIKWRLSKMLPGVYGERQHIEHSGGLKIESIRAHAPEWMTEQLTGLVDKEKAGALVAQPADGEEPETVH